MQDEAAAFARAYRSILGSPELSIGAGHASWEPRLTVAWDELREPAPGVFLEVHSVFMLLHQRLDLPVPDMIDARVLEFLSVAAVAFLIQWVLRWMLELWRPSDIENEHQHRQAQAWRNRIGRFL